MGVGVATIVRVRRCIDVSVFSLEVFYVLVYSIVLHWALTVLGKRLNSYTFSS